MVLLPQLINLLDILGLQLTSQTLKVLRNPLLVLTLRDHTRAPTHSPRQSNLRGRATALLGDLVDHAVIEQGYDVTGAVRGVRAGQGRVGGDVDTVVGVELKPFVLLEVGVHFHLVDARGVGGVVQEVLELRWGEVGDADVAGEAFLLEEGECGPGKDHG